MIYRDSKTGRFVSRQTWKRSKAQGGSRYLKVRKHIRKRRKAPLPPSREQFLVTFSYEHKGREKIVDFIAIARNEEDAEKYAKKFIEKHPKKHGWMERIEWGIRIASTGQRSRESLGHVELR